jgi:hypothetical protein
MLVDGGDAGYVEQRGRDERYRTTNGLRLRSESWAGPDWHLTTGWRAVGGGSACGGSHSHRGNAGSAGRISAEDLELLMTN